MKIGMVIQYDDAKKIIANYFKLDITRITHFDMDASNIMFNYDDDE